MDGRGDRTGAPLADPERVQRELWSLFYYHGYLCSPRFARTFHADEEWSVRFVGLCPAAHTRLVWLLGQVELPPVLVTAQRPKALAVSGQRAVRAFRQLLARFASAPKPDPALWRTPKPRKSKPARARQQRTSHKALARPSQENDCDELSF
jgi:hypothetical protein